LKAQADNFYQYQSGSLGTDLYQDFEDFADAYHLRQCCAMLVQMLVDKNSGMDDHFRSPPYLVSMKADLLQKQRAKNLGNT
jgi:hypothetical protein